MKTAGLYIHIPFCERKCTYCNFNTTDYFDDLAARYVAAVAREIEHWGPRFGEASGERLPIDTIYFGGGTPSLLTAEQIAGLIEASQRAFDVEFGAEITIEINPAQISRRRLEGWRAAGVNRVSVGVQSFLDEELVTLSRTHDSQLARRAVEQLREAGFDNLSLDLIAGLPGQSLADWQFNLEQALALEPDHLSLYLLEIKEGTQLFAQVNRGQRPRPDEDLAAEMYETICRETAAAGFEQYEISNFARLGRRAASSETVSPFRSRHNLKYWTDAPYLGVGCGAHSYDRRARWSNIRKTETYIEAVHARGEAIAETINLGAEERAAEALFMGLRLREGIDLEAFRESHGVDVRSRYGEEMARLIEGGLVEVEGGRLRLTARGRLLSNEVFVAFV